jgi:hypothetical protein
MIYDPTRKWQIALTDIILPNNNGHWLYVKVPYEEGLTTSEVFASEGHVDPLRDEGFLIYKIGYAHPVVDGSRELSMLWGNMKPRNGIPDAPVDEKTYGRKDGAWNALGSISAKDFWTGTLTAYNAIETKDSNTIYFIEE